MITKKDIQFYGFKEESENVFKKEIKDLKVGDNSVKEALLTQKGELVRIDLLIEPNNYQTVSLGTLKTRSELEEELKQKGVIYDV